MTSGSPPTERNARTGLLTPPTRTFSARSKISRERFRSGFKIDRVTLISAPLPLLLQPSRHVFRVISQNNVRARSLNAGKNLQNHALLVEPALFRRGRYHRIFPADVLSGNRHIAFLP